MMFLDLSGRAEKQAEIKALLVTLRGPAKTKTHQLASAVRSAPADEVPQTKYHFRRHNDVWRDAAGNPITVEVETDA